MSETTTASKTTRLRAWPIVAGLVSGLVFGAAGLPNQITFFAAYAPPALAVSVPVELLPIFLAIDAIPDIFYTVTNVTADLAVTSVVSGGPSAS